MKLARPALAVVCIMICVLIAVVWVRGQFQSGLFGYAAGKPGGRMRAGGVMYGKGGIALVLVSDMEYRSEINGLFLQHEPAGYAGDIGQQLTPWKAAGFILVRMSSPTAAGWAVAAPLWSLLLLAAVYPAWRYRGLLRRERQRRERLGLCLSCGYDLRASSERCPECGAPVPAIRCPNPTPFRPTAPAVESAAASSGS